MKHLAFLPSIISLFSLVIFLQSCSFDECKETRRYVYYRPVHKTVEQIRDIKILGPEALKNPGKIYVYGDYLFVNEINRGIHIFDNSDVNNPVNLSFISIYGNVDLAIKDNILYADNLFDLISIDITDPKNPRFVNSVKEIFKKVYSSNRKYVVEYIPTDTSVVIDCSNPYWVYQYYERDGGVYVSNDKLGESGSSWNPPPNPNGVGGSMARFTIYKNSLYTINRSKINVFNITNPQAPYLTNTVNVGWGIETLFPYKDNLFIGSNTGMYIYNLQNPNTPTFQFQFRHGRACDPVYALGDYAYVTLRTGTRCGGDANQLDVLDIKDLKNPKLIKSYQMSNPHGLGVIGDKLILCEGAFGLKVLDIKDKKNITVQSKIESGDFFDVIPLSEDDIIVVGKTGLYQYKLDNYQLKELSLIPIALE